MAFPEHSALVIIDMQKAFVKPGAALCIHGAAVTVAAVARLAAAARQQQVPVIWVCRSYAPDGSNMEPPRWRDLVARGYGASGVLAPGSRGINSEELAEGLSMEPGDYRLVKPRYSAFFHTELEALLQRLGVRTLVISGTTVPNCIRSTAYDALSLDLETIVPGDTVSSISDDIQEANLRDMARAGVIICQSDVLIQKGKEEKWMK